MLIGIFGEEFGYNMGNLKTYTMTWNLYLDYMNGMDIYANYDLKFKHKKIHGFSELLAILSEVENCSIALDELHVFMDAYSGVSKKSGTWYLKEFGRQTRKRGVKVYLTAQCYMDIHRSIRRILLKAWETKKFDLNGAPCYDDQCHQPHILRILDIKSTVEKFYYTQPEIYEMYDTNQIIQWEDDSDEKEVKPKRTTTRRKIKSDNYDEE